MVPPIIYTIGHSTRSLSELLDLISQVGVRELVDVRNVPRSRIRPHFSEVSLSLALPRRGIAYVHDDVFGGHPAPRVGSPNSGWQSRALRGFADYMASNVFVMALEDLQLRARDHVVCLMCAELHWRRCHRRLISDALLAKGWRVMHLGIHTRPRHHELTPFAVINDHVVTYPPFRHASISPGRGR
jgi:uncharacterized protein (DUF488 family)